MPAGRRVRVVEGVRAGWGAVLLCAPQRVLAGATGSASDPRAVLVARILGARHLTQAVLSGLTPSPEVLAMGVWVDSVHALTAIGLAAADRPRARAALIDALIAATWAAAGRHDLQRGPVPPPAHERRRDGLARWTLAHVPAGGTLATRARQRRAETPPT